MTAGEDTESARTRQVAGIRTFAGVLMLVIGGYHAMAGIAALVEDEIFLETPSYTYALDVTTWGGCTSGSAFSSRSPGPRCYGTGCGAGSWA
jgi:hypothetical protein